MGAGDLRIESRFHGPPRSGNGGYTCGLLAARLHGPATVRLRVPPPLDEPLLVEAAEGGARLLHGAQVVAEARAGAETPDPPAPPTFAEATAASRTYEGFSHHWFPTCFVCGPQRDAGEGLRIFPGRLGESKEFAAPWIPDASLGDADGVVRNEYLWAALDCPGAHSFAHARDRAVVLGELGVRLFGSVRAGERCVVVGWEIEATGRRHFTGTALFGEDGTCRGVGRAVWFEVPAEEFLQSA